MSKSLEARQAKEEAKNERKSALITGGITLVILIFSLFWTAFSGPVPPPEQEQYITTGRIDFGNFTEGSQQVNNFQDPSPNPSEQPKKEKTTEVTETSPQQSVSQTTEKVASPDKETDVAVKTEKSEATKDNSTNNSNNQEVKKEEPRKIDENSQFDLDDGDDGGSNHGNSDKVGNKGNPDTRVLDPNGGISFGDGGNGNLNGRIAIDLPQPKYTAQQDAKLTFTITIRPDGTVKYVKSQMTEYEELARAGKEAIYKWKFNDIGKSGAEQTTRVTIKFFRK